jgi:SSS family solute:Na+ symporter
MSVESISLSLGDQFVLALFFLAIIIIGLRYVRGNEKLLDYMVGGRKITLPVFVLTLFATWYGGILGVGEFGFMYGISSWILQGVPYYFFACIFALFIAKRARKAQVYTIPDQLEKVYGRNVSLLGAAFTGILACPAPYVLMFAILLQIITGWSLMFCMLFGIGTSLFYLWFGGFKADVAIDVFFGILMILGFVIILPFLYLKFGGYEFLETNLPTLHLQWHGGNSWQFIVTWFFIALWTFIEPTFYQRCYAAENEEVAMKGVLYSIVFWFVFDLMTVIAALYSKAIFKDLEQPMYAYPLLANLVLPSFWKGFFFAGMFATILSTLNSWIFVSATSIGRDFFWRLLNKKEDVEIRWIQIGMLITALLSIWLSYKVPSVVKLWYTIGTVLVPGLFLAMISTFFVPLQIDRRWILATMVGGFGTSLFCLIWGWKSALGSYENYPLGLEPMFPGLFMSIIIWSLGKFFGNRLNR